MGAQSSVGPGRCLETDHVEQSVRKPFASGSDRRRAALHSLLRHEGGSTVDGNVTAFDWGLSWGVGFASKRRAQRCGGMPTEVRKESLGCSRADSAGKHFAAGKAPLEHVLPNSGPASRRSV